MRINNEDESAMNVTSQGLAARVRGDVGSPVDAHIERNAEVGAGESWAALVSRAVPPSGDKRPRTTFILAEVTSRP